MNEKARLGSPAIVGDTGGSSGNPLASATVATGPAT
jgi:hypothetical protein